MLGGRRSQLSTAHAHEHVCMPSPQQEVYAGIYVHEMNRLLGEIRFLPYLLNVHLVDVIVEARGRDVVVKGSCSPQRPR